MEVRSREGKWVGISGRARVVVYNSEKLTEADLPDSILDFTDSKWKGPYRLAARQRFPSRRS